MKYRKAPVIIEAVEYTGLNIDEIETFAGKSIESIQSQESFVIKTLEGEHIASVGDYIIKGVKGEFYPCKPDIFKLTYDKSYEKTRTKGKPVAYKVPDAFFVVVESQYGMYAAKEKGRAYYTYMLEKAKLFRSYKNASQYLEEITPNDDLEETLNAQQFMYLYIVELKIQPVI